MHVDWEVVLTIVVTALGILIRQAIKTPSDHDKAVLLATLADDAAAVVVNLMPGADWPKMLEAVIAKIEVASGIKNAAALEGAATGALTRLGLTLEGIKGENKVKS